MAEGNKKSCLGSFTPGKRASYTSGSTSSMSHIVDSVPQSDKTTRTCFRSARIVRALRVGKNMRRGNV